MWAEMKPLGAALLAMFLLFHVLASCSPLAVKHKSEVNHAQNKEEPCNGK